MDNPETVDVGLSPREAVSIAIAHIAKQRREGSPQPIPLEVADIRLPSDEIDDACAILLNLPPEVTYIHKEGCLNAHLVTYSEIHALARVTEATRHLLVDTTTGLETIEVMKHKLKRELLKDLSRVREWSAQPLTRPELIAKVRSELTDEYQQQLDNQLDDLNNKIQSESDPDQRASLEADNTKRILEHNYLLSQMSTMAVGSSDIQGMKTANTFFQYNPRRDFDYEEATNELGIKPQGGAKCAISVLTGNHEYLSTLQALNGAVVKTWQSESVLLQINADYHLQRARQLVSPANLEYLTSNGIQCIEYRRRIEAGDEGGVLILKNQKTEDGRPVPLDIYGTQTGLSSGEDFTVLIKVLSDVSYVKIGEYTPEQSSWIREIVKSYLGNRSILSFNDENIPVYIKDRVSLVRLDNAFKHSGSLDSNEIQELLDNPQKLIDKAIDAAFILAGNTMSEAKNSEPKDFLLAAINGDVLAQLFLAQSFLNNRSLADPRALLRILQSPPYDTGAPMSREAFESIYPQIEHRQSNWPAPRSL